MIVCKLMNLNILFAQSLTPRNTSSKYGVLSPGFKFVNLNNRNL